MKATPDLSVDAKPPTIRALLIYSKGLLIFFLQEHLYQSVSIYVMPEARLAKN